MAKSPSLPSRLAGLKHAFVGYFPKIEPTSITKAGRHEPVYQIFAFGGDGLRFSCRCRRSNAISRLHCKAGQATQVWQHEPHQHSNCPSGARSARKRSRRSPSSDSCEIVNSIDLVTWRGESGSARATAQSSILAVVLIDLPRGGVTLELNARRGIGYPYHECLPHLRGRDGCECLCPV